ncbi:uncharacterized protein B0H64DRAFT_379256 [Chaetomium fimeti]|uniref:Uncharacterized protein n=1 Tax=Chaetomium fimeti TaxID=1854472 RepID=A0AAE0HNR8_9PEZI|nr:hypothetical protein B0H64DRAFT_379256 [Chaetomium fimeti]
MCLGRLWTGMMASATVGTNSRVAPGPSKAGDDPPTTRATIYARRITYDPRYAAPAAVVLAAWVALLFGGLLAGVVHRRLFAHLEEMVNDTSVGRVAAAAADPGARKLLRRRTKTWVEGAGYVPVQLGDGWEGDEDQEQGVVSVEADKYGREFHHSLLAPSRGP